ncbi:hypothetical protein FB567DRAFT_337550 [Paraphoma chrysanthemicola]|uniref:DUF1275 domain protein n=1 Tax=Paraphoma chrysanthemicola TaxID=798071 RepID=A0A8K0VZR1_9PLEO|nr:hypothetical protein FB567DRAFT_337550 [Paraphoma chrysanthemicola]
MGADTESLDGAKKRFGLRRHFNAQVDTKWADVILLGCFYCSGLIDSMAFNMYGCFVSMQTGNTIFIGLGANSQPTSAPHYSWSKSLLAVACFALGCLFFSTLHRSLGPQRRIVLVSSFLLQALLIGIVSIIATTGAVPNHPPVVVTDDSKGILTFSLPSGFPASEFGPLALLAFQSAGQIVASRALKYNAMPTVVLTSLYCDLMSDAQLFTAPVRENADRNRRFLGAVALLAGAISGAFLTASKAGFMGGLWIGCAVKMGMAGAWMVWREKETGGQGGKE